MPLRLLASLWISLFILNPLAANNKFGYNEEHPLVIVSDWDFHPFEFIDAEGRPSGYNVEVLDIIFNQLGIPHKFVMEEWHVATDLFKNRQADLIHALYPFFKEAPYVSTHKYINYYTMRVARRTDTPPLNRLSKLRPTDKLLLKEEDYAAIVIPTRNDNNFITEYHTPKNALTGIRQGIYKYFIWGEKPLEHKIQELSLDSIALDEIDIPPGELRIIGYNQELVDIIDDQYTRLEQAGELQKVYDKWFHPERVHDDASPVAMLIIVGLFLVSVVVFLLAWLLKRRVRKAVRRSSDLSKMMNQVLNMGEYFIVVWDFKDNMLRNKYGNMLPNGDMKPEEFLTRMPPEEAKKLHTLNAQLATGVISHFDMSLCFNQGTIEKPVWRNFYGNAIVEMDKGKPQNIVYTIKDITSEINEDRRIRTVASKYKKMFDTNLVAMSLYDAEGNLLDTNKKMSELCEITSENEDYFRKSSLFSFPNIKGTYRAGTSESMHVCQHLHEPLLGLDKYIEFRIQPVLDDNDELIYYIVTNRDVTAERDMYMNQREHDRQLHATNEAVNLYEKQLGYLLEESQMFIWNYRPSENIVNLTRSPGQTEFSETIEEYFSMVKSDNRQRAMAEMHKAMKNLEPYNTILLFDYTQLDDQPSWYSISGIPLLDKDGKLTEYFGLARNITGLLTAQEKLRVETARAEDSGRLKAAFLANMTHEIRTPLNAIVGFSDLLPMIDDDSEKKEIIRIIRNNCDMLLRLINDILEASNIESRPMSIEPADVDFAQAFDDICQTLAQRVQEPDVEFIKENPYTSLPTHLDIGRMQQVITNFVTNAVKYTKEGHIKVGYKTTGKDDSHFKDKGLYIYCEDTGAGIPKDKQSAVFDRFVKLNEFVQGTGLGLSICKNIAERCKGDIGVRSEGPGHGSTFWIWIPCPLPDDIN